MTGQGWLSLGCGNITKAYWLNLPKYYIAGNTLIVKELWKSVTESFGVLNTDEVISRLSGYLLVPHTLAFFQLVCLNAMTAKRTLFLKLPYKSRSKYSLWLLQVWFQVNQETCLSLSWEHSGFGVSLLSLWQGQRKTVIKLFYFYFPGEKKTHSYIHRHVGFGVDFSSAEIEQESQESILDRGDGGRMSFPHRCSSLHEKFSIGTGS